MAAASLLHHIRANLHPRRLSIRIKHHLPQPSIPHKPHLITIAPYLPPVAPTTTTTTTTTTVTPTTAATTKIITTPALHHLRTTAMGPLPKSLMAGPRPSRDLLRPLRLWAAVAPRMPPSFRFSRRWTRQGWGSYRRWSWERHWSMGISQPLILRRSVWWSGCLIRTRAVPSASRNFGQFICHNITTPFSPLEPNLLWFKT